MGAGDPAGCARRHARTGAWRGSENPLAHLHGIRGGPALYGGLGCVFIQQRGPFVLHHLPNNRRSQPKSDRESWAPSRLQRGPFPLTQLSGLGSLQRPALQGCSPSSTSWSPCPMPPALRLTPAPRASALELGAPTHFATAAQLLQRDVHGGVRTGGTLGLPESGPHRGRGLDPRPGPAARHHSRCHSPSLGRRRPRLPEPPPPPAAPRPRVGEWGGGGAHQPLPAIRRAPRPPSLREPAALLSCANLTPQPERTALQKRGRPPPLLFRVSTPSQQHPLASHP